jgi:3-hydroxymyristoyl/3-hydroxydecanoyl-(acyl carrier protein) dehydratase
LFTRGINELKKHLKNILRNYTDVVPQKWCFNNCIPTTQTGKIDKAFINKIFATNFSFPVILDSISSENEIKYKIFFNKGCNFYNGHFPDFPVTPGVVQLYIASELANHSFKINTIAGQIKKIKFSNIIHPDTIIELSLIKKESGIEYKYSDATTTYSSGILPIKNIFKGEV